MLEKKIFECNISAIANPLPPNYGKIMAKKATENLNRIIDDYISEENYEYQESFIEKMEMISKEESIPFEDPRELFD